MPDDGKKSGKIRAYLQLLRPPNLFTVPGDVFAGYLLVGGSLVFQALPLAAASVFAYIFGLLTNDLADLEEDRKERPGRPLPSGAVSIGSVRVAAGVSALIALALSAVCLESLILCAAMLGAVLLYNYRFKHKRVIGGYAMGLCRFLNVLFGASPLFWKAAFWDRTAVLVCAAGIGFYIAGITIAAKDETQILKKRPGGRTMLFGAILVYLTIFTLILNQTMSHWLVCLCGVCAAITSSVFVILAFQGKRMFHFQLVPQEIQHWIGLLIWNLIFFHAAVAATANYWALALLFLVAAWLAKVSARKFYGS